MAAGDRAIKVLHRGNLPQGGYDLSGASKQYVQVMAHITGEYATNGIALKPKDIGLKTIQHISVGICKVNTNTETTATSPYGGVWDGTAQKLILVTNNSSQAEANNAGTFTVTIVAIGQGPVELTRSVP